MWPTWINTLSLWQWGILAAVPPAVIALYFLKLRRHPLEVPSTYLWHRAIEDLHVNSLWQRLRQSLLLFLQLLILLLVIIALLRPGWRGTELLGDRFIFLIDTSASMNATDVEPTRLEFAKKRVDELIASMKSGDVAMVVSFSDEPHVEQAFTDNRRQLRKKVAAIRPTNRRSDLTKSLPIVAGLANPGRSSTSGTDDIQVATAQPANLYIFSDGRFDSVPEFDMGNLDPTYVPIGEGQSNNLAITAFNVQRNQETLDQLQAFASIENFGDEPVTVTASLYLDDDSADSAVIRDAAEVTVEPGKEKGVQFDLTGELEEGILRLELDETDHLQLDNRAYAVINPPREVNILLVTPGGGSLERVLSTGGIADMAQVSIMAPSQLSQQQHLESAAAGAYDLIIYEACVPTVMPRCNTLFIGTVPPALNVVGTEASEEEPSSAEEAEPAENDDGTNSPIHWVAGEATIEPIIVDVAQTHPLMQYIELSDVLILEATPLLVPPGGTTLIDSDAGTLLGIAPRDSFEDVVLGFELVSGEGDPNTNWPIRRSFAIFALNIVHYLGGATIELETATIRPGDTMTIRTEGPVPSIRITDPDNQTTTLKQENADTFLYNETEQFGAYAVRQDDKDEITQRFSVNLFDTNESNIRPIDKLNIGAEEITGARVWQPLRREAWKYLLLLVLCVLLFEWYIYNRRVYL